jgi:DNA-binding transcriptional LysR family regulator
VQRRLRETGGTVALRASNMPMQLAAIRAGAGRGLLPRFIGDDDRLLERLTPPMLEIAAEYWIIAHRALRPVTVAGYLLYHCCPVKPGSPARNGVILNEVLSI